MPDKPDNGEESATSDHDRFTPRTAKTKSPQQLPDHTPTNLLNKLFDDGCFSSDATGSERIATESERIEILEMRSRKMMWMSILFFVMFCSAVVTAFFYFAPHHSHDYADSYHSHDYADSYHSHRYAEEDHRHYNYAEDGHTHDWEHWH